MSDAGYDVPAATTRVEDVVQRSRFIATLGAAADAEAARAFIDGVREEFPDATHNCWAYVAGPPGSTAVIGMSDAGEPHGTAGRPMLDVLLHSGVGEVVAVVTRYYGGTKLGKGGLVRAYGGAVQHALVELPRARRVRRSEFWIQAGYGDVDPLRRLIAEYQVEVLAETFGEHVQWHVAVPAHDARRFVAAVAAATAGKARLESG
ncbi:MAG TPA: YigZ family protein [Longimicrobiales bacterium]|nr:YigZ family protein [Longimicrobiales bacterium]